MAIENLSRIEDSEWDGAVLGPLEPLSRGFGNLASLRMIDWPRFSPISQLLLLARSWAGTPESPTTTHLARRGDTDLPFLVAHGLRMIDHPDALSAAERPADFAWRSLYDLSLQQLDERFENIISQMLADAGATEHLTSQRRRRLSYLLFHPLQNALQHASPLSIRSGSRGFGGVAIRVVDDIVPATPSSGEYRAALSKRFSDQHRFIEITIHDDGQGIAEHYARLTLITDERNASVSVYSLEPEREWLFLKSAFERHATSRFFRDSVDRLSGDDVTHSPGIGLAAMITAVRILDVYFEVRCGRMRLYRWFRDGERVSQQHLTHPEVPPEPLPLVRGTLIRLFVPFRT
jgi:hypothetical protein